MKTTQSRIEVLMDEWRRCEVCGKFLKSGQKSYCCIEHRREGERRKSEASKKIRDAESDKLKENKRAERKKKKLEREEREHVERERKKAEREKKKLEREERKRVERERKIEETIERARREVAPLIKQWEAAKREGDHKRAKALGKKARAPWIKKTWRAFKPFRRLEKDKDPIMVECPNCGSLKQILTQRLTKRRPKTKLKKEELPKIDTPTKWIDIETRRKQFWLTERRHTRWVFGGLIKPDTQYGTDRFGFETQREIIIYITKEIKDKFISEIELPDFFETMSDALLRNNIIVSAFVLRRLCQMHVDYESARAEDIEYLHEMNESEKAYIVEEWMRHTLVRHVRSARKKKMVICPECHKIWSQSEKGVNKIWTHPARAFGGALRSDEDWVICKKCEDGKEPTKKVEKAKKQMRLRFGKQIDALMTDKREEPTDESVGFVRERMIRIRGAVICRDCGTHLWYEFEYKESDDHRQYLQESAFDNTMAESFIDQLAGEGGPDTPGVFESGKCDICYRWFYKPQGASGVCENCAPKIYLEKGMIERSCDYDVYQLIEIHEAYKDQIEKGSIDDLCKHEVNDLFGIYNSYLEREATDNLFDRDIYDFFEVYDTCYHKRETMSIPCDCEICAPEFLGAKGGICDACYRELKQLYGKDLIVKKHAPKHYLENAMTQDPHLCRICGLEIHHTKRDLIFTVGLQVTRRGRAASKHIDELDLAMLECKFGRPVTPRGDFTLLHHMDKTSLKLLSEIFRRERWHDILRDAFGRDTIPFHITKGNLYCFITDDKNHPNPKRWVWPFGLTPVDEEE